MIYSVLVNGYTPYKGFTVTISKGITLEVKDEVQADELRELIIGAEEVAILKDTCSSSDICSH